jgi:DNA invertase Pin-like site-specific DNA recombinase
MKQKSRSFIAYYRVSTDRQSISKLGLEAQQETVRQYLAENDVLISEVIEVESGKKSNRPKLQEAIRECKRQKATLLIAKLDRLARNVHFISGMMESGIEFVAADNPHANKLMLHLLAAFAEHEREQISIRTKQALAAAKKRGVKLGENAKSLENRNSTRADIHARKLEPVLREIIQDGAGSYRKITAQLNAKGYRTTQGKLYSAASVYNLIKRLKLQ